MAPIFRTSDLLRWGVGKLSPLTKLEGDENLWHLIERIFALETNPPTANSIANIQVVGSQFKVILTDTTELGPFSLPVAMFTWREEGWVNAMTYLPFNMFAVPNVGLFVVLEEHVTPIAPATFDANAIGVDGQLYHQIFGLPPVQGLEYGALTHAAFGGI